MVAKKKIAYKRTVISAVVYMLVRFNTRQETSHLCTICTWYVGILFSAEPVSNTDTMPIILCWSSPPSSRPNLNEDYRTQFNLACLCMFYSYTPDTAC